MARSPQAALLGTGRLTALWVSAGLAALTLWGCAAGPRVATPSGATAPSASTFWVPPAGMRTPAAPPAGADIPQEYRNRNWTLSDVLDLALRNNPSMRSAWHDARAAAAGYEAAKGPFLPQLDLNASVGLRESRSSQASKDVEQVSYGPSVSLAWLLLDFGGRSASLESARQSLLAANWTQNRALQDVVLGVEVGYFNYLAAKAVRDAREASLRDAQISLDAADARHRAGVATIADVLQAKTAVAQARLALQTAEGLIQTTRGSLAASMGLPANLPFDIERLPAALPLEKVAQAVDDLIQQALAQRPDLAAARAQTLASEADARRVQAAGLPTLSLGGSGGRTYVRVGDANGGSDVNRHEDAFTAALLFQFPLFTGFAQTFSEKRALEQAESSRERAKTLEQRVILQVFSAYYAVQTATEKVRTSEDLFASAQQSEAVALGRYKEGVGTILDLVAAQTALSDARAQRIQSRWEWYTALALLAHDTGLLGLHGETPLSPAIGGGEQKK